MSAYLEFTITCPDEIREQLIAELAEVGYEGFIEHDNGFEAYIPDSLFNKDTFALLIQKYGLDPDRIPHTTIPQQNWNAQWEAGYEPIIIDNKIAVIAPFHQMDLSYETEILIKPKNTFGTGHHETTQLMLKLMSTIQWSGLKVFDYGCGTGVLGIMASLKGASSVFAIDIDEWSADNIAENTYLNQVNNLTFVRGDLSIVPDQHFDAILANINKNILLHSFSALSSLCRSEGSLLISGFYENDLTDLLLASEPFSWTLKSRITLNNWCAAHLSKS